MDALTMGGYGPYVWSSFGLTLIVIIICALQARRLHRRIFIDITARIRAMESER